MPALDGGDWAVARGNRCAMSLKSSLTLALVFAEVSQKNKLFSSAKACSQVTTWIKNMPNGIGASHVAYVFIIQMQQQERSWEHAQLHPVLPVSGCREHISGSNRVAGQADCGLLCHIA